MGASSIRKTRETARPKDQARRAHGDDDHGNTKSLTSFTSSSSSLNRVLHRAGWSTTGDHGATLDEGRLRPGISTRTRITLTLNLTQVYTSFDPTSLSTRRTMTHSDQREFRWAICGDHTHHSYPTRELSPMSAESSMYPFPQAVFNTKPIGAIRRRIRMI